jgi:hypothetical protein
VGHAAIVEILFPLMRYWDILNTAESRVVHWALRADYVRLLIALLDRNIYSNEKDSDGDTLISAIRRRNADIIVELLDRYVDLKAA